MCLWRQLFNILSSVCVYVTVTMITSFLVNESFVVPSLRTLSDMMRTLSSYPGPIVAATQPLH